MEPLVWKPYTYEQWKAINPDALEEEVDCSLCQGFGDSVCLECNSEIDCPDCEGSGRVKDARSLYNKQLEEDRKRVEDFNKTIGVLS